MLIFSINLCSETKLDFNCPDGFDNKSYLRKLALEGMEKRGFECNQEIEKRLNYELEIIHANGLDSFFLVLWDAIRYARENGIHVGPGRGALPSSLVSYSLYITQVDPIRNGLLFERYLAPGKIESKEEWVDLDQTRQEEVLNYVKGKYCRTEPSFEVCDRNDWAGFQYIPELTLISEVLESVKAKYNMEIDIDNIDYSDKNIFELIGKEDFYSSVLLDAQFSHFISNMKPSSMEELIAGSMLCTEGRHEKLSDCYMEARKVNREIRIRSDAFKAIVKPTYGLLLWQEQIIKVFMEVGGFLPKQGNDARRALGKMALREIDEYEKKFIYGCEEDGIPGCVALGVSEEDGMNIFTMMRNWTKYTMTKSHVLAMSMIVYQTMWLKYYYPAEYADAQKDVCFEFLNISD